MGFFRSEPMTLWHLLMHSDTIFDCMVELGHLGLVEFTYTSDDYLLPNMMYTQHVRRCVNLLQKLKFVQAEFDDAGKEIVFYPNVDEDHRPKESDIPYIEDRLNEMKSDLKECGNNRQELKKRLQYLKEWYQVVTVGHKWLGDDQIASSQTMSSGGEQNLLLHDESQPLTPAGGLHYVAGIITASLLQPFRMMMYRFFSFNIMLHQEEIPEEPPPTTPTPTKVKKKNKKLPERKYVIMIMGISPTTRTKVLKLCHAFHVNIYECPELSSARENKAKEIAEDIKYVEMILAENEKLRQTSLEAVQADMYIWRVNLKKSLMIYILLNKFNLFDENDGPKYLFAECWIPENELVTVRHALVRGATTSTGSQFMPLLMKHRPKFEQTEPTFFRLNKFTRGFQNLINSYGMADYRELNPAPYTIITFPFLFAVMFGDIGHGIIIVLAATYLIVKEKSIAYAKRMAKQESEIFDLLFAGRYILLLMGLFSVYTGAVYNDIFSKNVPLLPSRWRVRINAEMLDSMPEHLQLNPSSSDAYTGSPVWFGVDKVWHIAGESSITTFNSLKMKTAIVLGVSQMMFGLVLAAVNAIHFRKKADFLLVVLPTIIFMVCLFCYLVFLIIFKWLNYGGHIPEPGTSACAPSILIMFIDMVLFKDSITLPEHCDRQMYAHQKWLQRVLIIIALLNIPILLAGKPIYLMVKQRKLKSTPREHEFRSELGRSTLSEVRTSLRYNVGYGDDETVSLRRTIKLDTVSDVVDFDMSEVWIHSGIHSIETVLGSVSHTASYLRLWALSLAHDQLATVLWDMVFRKALTARLSALRIVMIVIFFSVWAVLTLAILVAMEGLSAFLHTLRLHWVEFQSKFYNGAGEVFNPFRFEPSTVRT